MSISPNITDSGITNANFNTSCHPLNAHSGEVVNDLAEQLVIYNKFEENQEKEKLRREIEQLKKSKTYLESIISNLPHSFYYFCEKKNEAISRWSILNNGFCQLIEYSSEFVHLTAKNRMLLDSNFMCYQLYPPEFRGKTQIIIDTIGSGRISQITFQQIFESKNATPLFPPMSKSFSIQRAFQYKLLCTQRK